MSIVTLNGPLNASLRAMRDWDADLESLFDHLLLDRAAGRGRYAEIYPRMDVVERDDAWDVYADLPGVRQEDVDVSLTSNVLTIKGSGEGRGAFERALTLPEGIDAEKVSASMENGVLQLHIPKTKAAAARKIEIKGNK
ncbi:MAG: Hsp20/alpha crystallin family protein [Spirochaetaceae bacterium]|nr:MAG: Hsp20/alpha crystallin family protein [Spirochaetaceae bacterium]